MTNKYVISTGHSLYDIQLFEAGASLGWELCTLYGFYPGGFWINVCNTGKAISKKTLEVVKSALGEKGKFNSNLSWSNCNSTMQVSKFKIPKTGTK